MKKTFFKFSLACLALAVMGSTTALALNQLGDPGFEAEQNTKITNFANGQGWWSDTGVNYTNSGYENNNPHSGTERAWEMSGDDGAYQIALTNQLSGLGYPMVAGDQITLSWYALATVDPSTGNTNPPVQVVGLIKANGLTDPFSACTILTNVNNVYVLSNGALSTNGLLSGWTHFTLNYTATFGDAGKYIGCYFVTTNAYGFVTNSFAGYDDFDLEVLPAGATPQITSEPTSVTAYTGSTNTFTVSAVAATGYQWMAGATGSAIYTNLVNGGQVSGVNTPNLTITACTVTNNGDYIVVVTNLYGSATSTLANLTVQSIIYRETFDNLPIQGNQSITNVGWRNDLNGSYGDSRIFSNNNGITYPNLAVWTDAMGVPSYPEAFYFTTATANGGPFANGTVTNQSPFPGINLAATLNVTFQVTCWEGSLADTQPSVCVQMNNGQWYVSTNIFTFSGGNAETVNQMNFTNLAGAWKLLTLSGTGTYNNTNYPTIGAAAGGNLTGYITGAGLVVNHLNGSATLDFDNFTILGAIPPNNLPVFTVLPQPQTNYTGNTVTFTASASSNQIPSAVTYQWQSRAAGSFGAFANVSGAQYSGMTSNVLTISNITSGANHLEYQVVATDGAGSVQSSLSGGAPAILTVLDSTPILSTDTSIYPDSTPSQGNTNSYNIHIGNHNVLHLTAAFTGDMPITYQWQYSPTTNYTPVTSVTGATNSVLTFSNPQNTNVSGYYRLAANNSQGGPTYSDWVGMTVLPAGGFQWSAKVPLSGLTASNILNTPPGPFYEAQLFGGLFGGSVTVTNVVGTTTNLFVFDGFDNITPGIAATITGGYTQRGNGQFLGPSTGDTNLDTVFEQDMESANGSMVTLNGLVVGTNYSVQLFAFNDVQASSRIGYFMSPTNDTANVSETFAMGDNVYVVGTFTATNTTQQIQMWGDTGTYWCAVIVRTPPPSPTLSIQKVGSTLQVSFANGVLYQANSVNGPWTSNTITSPYTFTPSITNGAKMFFRAQSR